MDIKDLYTEAVNARKNMGLIGGDITLLMNTLIMMKIYDKLDELKVVPEVINEVIENVVVEEVKTVKSKKV
jgi:hypothetical protein